MRIATWNINSVRLRIEALGRLATWMSPDVICLQETKVQDPDFPRAAIESLGYKHIAIAGMKSYNGVAILSRLPLTKIRVQNWHGKQDCRHLIAEAEGVEIHCVYVPAGGDIPDPVENVKFAHKLGFLDEVSAWFDEQKKSRRKMVLVGDLNVAPLPTDVWSHKQLLTVVSHTPIEVEKLGNLQSTMGWVDAVRHFVPPEIKLYSWWSYRNNDWAASDRGRRLDHIWVTPSLKKNLTGATILRETRGWELASDHVPVTVDLD